MNNALPTNARLMPYIITTKPAGAHKAGTSQYFTRIAVATLDEARDWSAEEVIERSYPGRSTPVTYPPLMAAYNLPESGGTIGPLPDGTVIEVLREG